VSAPRRGRLFWRLYLYGLALVLLVVVAAGVAGWLLGGHHPPRRQARFLAQQVAQELGTGAADRATVRRWVRDIHLMTEHDVAAYDASGRRVAAAGKDPPGPARGDERAAMADGRLFHRGSRVLLAVPLRGGGQIVMGWSGATALLRFVVILALILLVVALVSLPLTRTLTRPLQRIADAARALGQGDLTARTGLERRDELGRLARVLDEMAGRLERVVRGEKELWANISHEIRTPLARIRVALELAEEEGDADAVRRHLAGISEDLTELDRLLDDVLTSARLDLARGQAGGLVPHREPLDLAELVGEAARRFGERHPGRALEPRVANDLPALEGDRALLLRVLGNLLDNAVKYSEEAIELEATAAGEEVAVEVRDRGIGVADDDLPRLFDHFFRSDRSRSRGSGGSGLGLTLCRRIVEAHGGRIAAASREGGGLRVRFSLPARHSS